MWVSVGEVPGVAAVPYAVGDPEPLWPLDSADRVMWLNFGAPRGKGRRQHAGTDLPSPPGTVVIAPEAGRVVRIMERWTGPPTYPVTSAIMVQGGSGLVYLLGEVEPGSWAVEVGDEIEKGQGVARIGALSMLHFEAYTDGTTVPSKWPAAAGAPSSLLDPSEYVQRAQAAPMLSPIPGSKPIPTAPPVAPSLPEPAPVPVPSPQPPRVAGVGGGGGLLLLALVAAVALGGR